MFTALPAVPLKATKEIYHIFSSVQLTLQTAVWLIYRNHTWATCPRGRYLQGIYKSNDTWLHNIEEGKCCQPKGHPDRWGHCYEQGVSSSFGYEDWKSCSKGYYMVGIYKGSCDSILCIEKFKCCQMERKCLFLSFQQIVICFIEKYDFNFIMAG